MAKPRVFISSTYYDLRHIRASLERFVSSLGYEPILSEKGDIAYTPEAPLDESCYREVRNSDVFVLIVGGRYGSAASGHEGPAPQGFYDRYDSITRQEYVTASELGIPVYILVDSAVHTEYQTYLKNKSNESISYAHVDSVNIFALIEEVLTKSKGGPVQPFRDYGELEWWLRDQWAGLFRDLLKRESNQQQVASLSAQVEELAALNKTLKSYLEEVVSAVRPEASEKLIEEQAQHLAAAQKMSRLRKNRFVRWVSIGGEIEFEKVVNAIQDSDNIGELLERLPDLAGDTGFGLVVRNALERKEASLEALNGARLILERRPFEFRPC